MKGNNQLRYMMLAFLGLVLMTFAPIASATPVGHLDLANCSGGGAAVTATTINWLPDLPGGTDGCIQTGATTSINYSGGTLGPGVQGAIKDLNVANPLPIANFIVLPAPGTPVLTFELTGLGPGVSNTDCASLAIGESCAAFAGSPFILTKIGATQTTVILPLVGMMSDGSGMATWTGQFSTNISRMAPAAIQATILSGGTVSSTYAGDLNSSAVPEPATAASMMLGGLLLALAGRVIRKR